MAGHVDTPEVIADTASDTQQSVEPGGATSDQAEKRGVLSGTRAAVAVGLVIVAAVGGVAGWLGFRDYQTRQAESERNLYVQVARQAAVNLTTIDHAQVDADIQRILDSATGAFRDDFQSRAQPFIDVVKQVKSKSVGTVADAGLESETGDSAQVLVAVAVKTSTAAVPDEPEPRRWRLRITVAHTGDGAKISNVEFVP